jgi:predicted MFS family arabinose efflux permease
MSLPELAATRAAAAGAVAWIVIRRNTQRRNTFHPQAASPTSATAERASLTSVQDTLESPHIETHAKSRWSVFVAYGVLAAATQALVVNYAPVTGDAARHFGVSIAAIGWLSQVFPLIYVLLAVPAGLALDRYFRPALIAGAVLTAAGAFLRLVADDFTWTLIGQVVAAVGQPFVLNAIPGLAVSYLAVKDRTTGIAAASSATFGGMVVGYLLGACLPGENHIHTLTVITALFALDAGLFLLAVLRFTSPLGGPDAIRITGGLRAFRTAFGNRYLRRLCAVVAIPMGTFTALATFIQPLLEPAGVSESGAGLILALTMIAGVIGCAAVPVWADRHRREVQIMGVGIGFTAVACLHLAMAPSTAMASLTLIAVGFLLLPALPIVLALSERHAPDAESTAAGLIWMAGNTGGVVIATVVGLLVTHPATAFLVLAAATLMAMPALRWFDRLQRHEAAH